jgi:hypothetical protein
MACLIHEYGTMRRQIAAALSVGLLGLATGSATPAAIAADSGSAAKDRPVYSSIKELMESVIDPSADVLWGAGGTVVDKEGFHELAPKTDEQWLDAPRRGSYYRRWQSVDDARAGSRPRGNQIGDPGGRAGARRDFRAHQEEPKRFRWFCQSIAKCRPGSLEGERHQKCRFAVGFGCSIGRCLRELPPNILVSERPKAAIRWTLTSPLTIIMPSGGWVPGRRLG